MSSKLLFIVVIAASMSVSLLHAQDAPASTETRLREALRSTIQQLNDAQGQVATLQVSQAQSDKENVDLKAKVETLTAQVATLTKQSADDKAAANQAVADLNSKIAGQTDQIARLNQALNEWKTAYNQVSQLAAAREDARAKLALQAALLQRTVDDRESKNLELYKTGSEILTRYEKFGLGEAIGAKEPFVGLSRVKLQTLVQDYKDKLLDQTVTPGQPSAAATHPAVRTGQDSSPASPTVTKT